MSLPFFPLYPAVFEADTSHLTLEEDGAFNRLLRLMWLTPGCSIPDDPEWITRRMRVDAATFERVVAPILLEFCKRRHGRLHSPRLSLEWGKVDKSHRARSEAGKKGGRPQAVEKAPQASKPGESPASHLDLDLDSDREVVVAVGASPDFSGFDRVKKEPDDALRIDVMLAVGVPAGEVPKYWRSPFATEHCQRWLSDLGLSRDDVLTVAAAVRACHRNPPDGPKALDEAMTRLAGFRVSDPLTPAAAATSRNGGFNERVARYEASAELANRLSAGTAALRTDDRNPFAKRSGENLESGERGPGALFRSRS